MCTFFPIKVVQNFFENQGPNFFLLKNPRNFVKRIENWKKNSPTITKKNLNFFYKFSRGWGGGWGGRMRWRMRWNNILTSKSHLKWCSFIQNPQIEKSVHAPQLECVTLTTLNATSPPPFLLKKDHYCFLRSVPFVESRDVLDWDSLPNSSKNFWNEG